jgi:thiol:disulfide interchange protein DsbD
MAITRLKNCKGLVPLILLVSVAAIFFLSSTYLSAADQAPPFFRGPYQPAETDYHRLNPAASAVLHGSGATASKELSMASGHIQRVQQNQERESEEQTQKAEKGASIWLTLLALFLGGLALNLTPCVYPLIPITISYFGGKSEGIRGHTILHGILYMVGLAVTNSVLGLSAALTGGMLGFALQNPIVLILVAAVMVAMGLSFFGLWELRLPLWLTRSASKSYAGLFGTFFMGLTLGVVAAPCLGPFILGLLVYVGQVGDPFLGLLYFFTLSIGLGIPLALLAVFSGAAARLPKSGDWMIWIRKLMGWVLMAMAAFMVSFAISRGILRPVLLAGVALAAGIHLGWLDRTGRGNKAFSYAKRAVGIVVACGGIAYLLLSIRPAGQIQWIPYDQSVIAQAAEEKRPVILEFSADWCAPCRIMQREVFTDPEIIKLSRNFVMVRADLTRAQPFHDQLLDRYHIRGIPLVVFINSEGKEVERLRIVGLVDKARFVNRLEEFLKISTAGTG